MSDAAETNLDGDQTPAPGVDATDDDFRDVHPDNRPEPPADPDDDDDAGEPADDAAASGDDAEEEEEEIEHKGKKYKLPKSLAAERMMQSDYTRKTTELAEQRRVFEADKAARAADDEATREQYGQVHALKANLAAFDKIDWQALNQADPVEAQALWIQREQTKDALNSIEGELQKKVQERLQGQQQSVAKAMQETGQILSRDIKGWSPVLADQIATFGIKEFGLKPAEIQQMDDPRLWKVIHRVMVAEDALKKQAAGDRQAKLQAITPAPVVKARPAPTLAGLDDRLSQKAWLARRNEQLAKRKR